MTRQFLLLVSITAGACIALLRQVSQPVSLSFVVFLALLASAFAAMYIDQIYIRFKVNADLTDLRQARIFNMLRDCGLNNRLRVFIFVTSAFLFPLSFSLLALNRLVPGLFTLNPTGLSTGLQIVVLSTVVASSMLLYLQQEPQEKSERLTTQRSYPLSGKIGMQLEMAKTIINLQRKVAGITDESKDIVIDSLIREASAKFADMLDSELESRYGSAKSILQKISILEANANESISRLAQEIRALLKRGNLNLVLGTLASISAITLMIYITVFSAAGEVSIQANLQRYLLRLTLVVIIQIFGFFFLRLYRVSLDDIKYFQNEITNIEMQWLALKYSILNEDCDAGRRIAGILSATERNFILKKGETTIELERLRIDQGEIKEIITKLSALIQKSGSSS